MANANIDALYAGSLRIKIAFFVSEYFSFYKWCVTKVAHCTCQVTEKYLLKHVLVSLKFSYFKRNTAYFAIYCPANQE